MQVRSLTSVPDVDCLSELTYALFAANERMLGGGGVDGGTKSTVSFMSDRTVSCCMT